MTFAQNVTAFVAVVASALNARNAPGPSAYQMWLAAGNTGTVADFNTATLGGEQDWAGQFLTALAAPTSASADTLALFSGRRRGTDAQRLALTGAQLFDGLEFYCTDTRVTWRYLTANTPTGNTLGWKPWDSPYMAFQYSMANLAFGSFNVQYRYRGGVVRVKFFLSGTVATGSGVITMGLPVPADTGGLQKPVGRIIAYDAGQQFAPLYPEFVDPNTIKFQYDFAVANTTVQERDMTVAAPLGWNTGDQMFGVFEYEALNGV